MALLVHVGLGWGVCHFLLDDFQVRMNGGLVGADAALNGVNPARELLQLLVDVVLAEARVSVAFNAVQPAREILQFLVDVDQLLVGVVLATAA